MVLLVLSVVFLMTTGAAGETAEVLEYRKVSLEQLLQTRTTPMFSAQGFGNSLLKLGEPIDNEEGFVVCLNFYLTSNNALTIDLQADEPVVFFTMAFGNCLGVETFCDIWINYDNAWSKVSDQFPKRSYGWMHACISFDFSSRSLSVAYDQHVIHTSPFTSKFSLKTLKVSWDEVYPYVFPEMFTMLNIFTRTKSVESYDCGELGDLYAWNAADWVEMDGKKINIRTVLKIKQQICKNKEMLKLPMKPLSDSLKSCSAITNGTLFNGEHQNFLDNIELLGSIEYWLPYTDENDEGNFKNIYTDTSFDSSLFYPGEPNGGENENFLYWKTVQKGAGDVVKSFSCNSLCEPGVKTKSFKLRGLCSTSQIDKTYRIAMNTEDSSDLIGIGIGANKAFIQYDDTFKGLQLKTLKDLVSAEILVSDASLLIGKNEWKIYNDAGCSKDPSYTKTISFSVCEDNEYNCDDGSCVQLDKRCDGFIDCEDSTDESYCAENVEIDQSYDKLKVFKLDRTKINCYFNLTILDVISIDDCDNVFKAKFKIEIEWKDIRLKFRHAKKGLEVLLSNEEVNQLWMPNILMDDINQMNRDTSSPEEVFASLYPTATVLPSDDTDVLNTVKYSGNSTRLTLKTTQSASFSCSFSMIWNPFDVQVCSIQFRLSSWQLKYVEIVASHIAFTGKSSVQQFTLHSVKFLTDEEQIIHGRMVFIRKIDGFIITTALPSIIANIIGHSTNYFNEDSFEAAIGVNLTILLVLTTMLVEIATAFAQADGFAMIATWMFISLLLPFLEVMLQTLAKYLKDRDYENSNKVEPVDNFPEEVFAGNKKKKNWVIEKDLSRFSTYKTLAGNSKKTFLIKYFLRRIKVVLYSLFIIIFFTIGQTHKNNIIASHENYTLVD